MDVKRLLQAWQLLFVQAPWDPTDKVRPRARSGLPGATRGRA